MEGQWIIVCKSVFYARMVRSDLEGEYESVEQKKLF